MRLIDVDELIDDCKKYLNTLSPSRDGKECTRIHWLIGVLSNAPSVQPEPCEDAVSRQAAIDAMGIEPLAFSEYENGLYDKWEEDVEALMKLPSAQPEPQWIPVAEKPIEKGLMLVTYNDGDVDLLKQPTAYRRSDIVAWMPLPKPYKGADNIPGFWKVLDRKEEYETD